MCTCSVAQSDKVYATVNVYTTIVAVGYSHARALCYLIVMYDSGMRRWLIRTLRAANTRVLAD